MKTVERITSEPGGLDAGAEFDVSIVIPCLDEEQCIAAVVEQARAALTREGLRGEVLVVDNGSTDRSAELAAAAGADVVLEPRRGYGNAYLAGLARARGRYVLMGDADLSYDFAELPRFIAELEGGADFVVGDRMDNIEPGAMPWLHRHVGNPLLSGLLNAMFRTGVRDSHCGMRALRRSVLPRLDLRMPGMEFASEMVIRAHKEGLAIRQLPIRYSPRAGESKLSTVRDGWRHLRFLLVHSPTWLFIVPGSVLLALGAAGTLTVLLQVNLFGRVWDLHSLVGAALLMVVGTQVLCLGVCAHAYTAYFMGERNPLFVRVRARLRLEHGLLLGALVALAGVALCGYIIAVWASRGFGSLAEERLAVVAAALVTIGLQILFSSFLLSILGLRRER